MGCCSSKPTKPPVGKNTPSNQDGANTPIQISSTIQIKKLNTGGGSQTPADNSKPENAQVGNFSGINNDVAKSSDPHIAGCSGTGSNKLNGLINDDSKTVGLELSQMQLKLKRKPPPVYFDISSQSERTQEQIYQISTTEQPVQKPYSSLAEWQSVVQKSTTITQVVSEEELFAKILNLRNRNWVLEQIKLLNEQNSQSPQSLDSLLISRRILQLREHFNWFVWAIAQFYFFFNGLSNYYQQFQASPITTKQNGLNSTQAQSEGQSINSSLTGKNQFVSLLSILPKVGSKTWSDGFEYKGVYIRVIPYEDSKFIRNEIKALQYVQIELLELKSLAQSSGQPIQSQLHQEVLLPLITGVSFGGFYLYATPIIYVPKSPVLDRKQFQSIGNPKAGQSFPSLYSSPQKSNIDMLLKQSVQEEPILSESLFKFMHILKLITIKDLLPIYDYDSYPVTMTDKSVQPQLYYFMFNLYDRLPQIPLPKDQLMMRVPNQANEEITFHKVERCQQRLEEDIYAMEAKALRKFLQNGGPPKTGSFIGQQIGTSSIGGVGNKRMSLFMTQQKQPPVISSLDQLGESGDLELQADEYQNNISIEELENEERRGEENNISDVYQKRHFVKHGWEFTLIAKKQLVLQTATQQQPVFMSAFNENKRANNLYQSRECQLKGQPEEQKTAKRSSGIQISQLEEFNVNEGSDENNLVQVPHQFSIFQIKQENGNMFDQSEIAVNTNTNNQSKIYGNALITTNQYRKELKLQYCLINNQIQTNLEGFLNASIDQVVLVLENSDKILNLNSYKELMHRKGLNMRFSWLVLSKLRLNQARELVMIDILLRAMRKIINEEMKTRSITSVNTSLANDTMKTEQYYLGAGCGQSDNFKETVVFYVNTLLKRKMHKNRTIFEETLLSLFLARISVLQLLPLIHLKQEEFHYLESKDLLEDIIESPSRNPSLFLNSIQTSFHLDFSKDFLRQLRQDKFVFLSKTQPVLKQDIMKMSCRCSVQTYISLKEEAYFIMARSIKSSGRGASEARIGSSSGGAQVNMPSTAQNRITAQIKTKLEKDQTPHQQKVTSSFERNQSHGDINATQSLAESNEIIHQSSFGSGILPSQIIQQESSRGVLHDFRQPKDSQSTLRQYQNMEAIINESPLFAQNDKNEILDFSKINRRNNFKPSQPSEIVLPSILYKMKTTSNQSVLRFDDASEQVSVLRPYYELPSIDVIDEWTMVMESLLKDVLTVNGGEQVLLEAFIYQAIMIQFYKNTESDELLKVLTKIRDTLFYMNYCQPETLILSQIMTGMYFEEKQEQLQIESEKSYLTALLCILQQYGDPRGRGNYSIPYTLFLSWKLSLLSLTEDKKVHDSEFAEELFDATLRCLINHKSTYREHQLQSAQNALMAQHRPTNASSLPTEVHNPQAQSEKTQFEKQQEKIEAQRLRFDMKRYRTKPFNVTFASGMYRSNGGPIFQRRPINNYANHQQAAMNVYVTVNHHYQNNKELKGAALDRMLSDHQSYDMFKSRSIVGAGLGRSMKPSSNNVAEDQNHGGYDLEPSEIDLEIDEENKGFIFEENFKESEWQVGNCPFQHWSLYRQQIQQILQAHNLHRNTPAQAQYQKQIYKEMLHKFLNKDLFFQWLIRFNPLMYQSGQQWSSGMIRDFIFNQNQQMINSSSSSVVMSNHNMSHHSMRSNSGVSLGGQSIPTSAKERKNAHLGTYSQILGKEAGGISKQEMHGILFTMGTDGYGQLGVDAITPTQKETQSISLKVLFPRMVISLRDELIKEICCGHCHTLAINVHGQIFAWGLNESGQLGLGPDAPSTVRKPALNTYIGNVNKLSAGNEHSLAITKAGDLYIWGGGGLTGLGDAEQRSIPTKMEFFNTIGTKVQQAVCGGLHTVVITREGDTYSWGSTEGGQLGLPLPIIADLTQSEGIPILSPQKVPKLEGLQMIQVACGEAHTIGMAKDGRLFGWGMSNYGQLGLGFSSDSFEPGIGMEKSKVHEPTEITGLKGESRISKIICGATFSLFQTERGDLFGCGMNDLGQLGLDTFMEDIAGLDNVKKGKHNLNSSDVTVPTRVICFQGIGLHNLACGENHALAVSGDDKNMLWAWGMYRQGQLGLGEVTMKTNPRPVQTLCSSTIQKIACGSMHSLVLIGDSQHVQNLSAHYYAGASNFDVLQNHWQCDLGHQVSRSSALARHEIIAHVEDDLQTEGFQIHQLEQYWTNAAHNMNNNDGRENVRTQDISADDGEGRIKNPQ